MRSYCFIYPVLHSDSSAVSVRVPPREVQPSRERAPFSGASQWCCCCLLQGTSSSPSLPWECCVLAMAWRVLSSCLAHSMFLFCSCYLLTLSLPACFQFCFKYLVNIVHHRNIAFLFHCTTFVPWSLAQEVIKRNPQLRIT